MPPRLCRGGGWFSEGLGEEPGQAEPRAVGLGGFAFSTQFRGRAQAVRPREWAGKSLSPKLVG